MSALQTELSRSPALERLRDEIHDEYRARTPASHNLFERAKTSLPGGVSGNLRYFAPHPLYMSRGQGAFTVDVDGREYIDSFLCNGPLLLGHRHPDVEAVIEAQVRAGSLLLNPALLVDCAEKLCALVPCAERVRFLNSGTEAVLTAVRYARGYTGRSKVVKFFGHYHGQDDQFLVGAGPVRVPFGAGVPAEAYCRTITIPFNDIGSVHDALADDDIAAVVLDPAMHSGGLWGTTKVFLEELRELTRSRGVVLIFDEVITGFRMSAGGAQQLYGVTPDLATFAKALAAGERLGAVAGSADVMSVVDPLSANPGNRVFQSGTGNDGVRGLAAAMAALELYRSHGEAGDYDVLEQRAIRLAAGLRSAFANAGIACHVNTKSSMLQIFLTHEQPDFLRYSGLDQRLIDLFFLAMINAGVLLTLPTSNHIYLSFAHREGEIDQMIGAAREVLGRHDFTSAFGETQ